jgi:hypothetical protein
VSEPVVVIGMHRSGTSLVSSVLQRLGLFMGHRQDKNNEAVFFRRLNDWLLHQSGAEWDNPEPFHRLVTTPEVRGLAVDYLRGVVRSPRTVGYLGPTLRHLGLAGLEEPWGWKDPRNTFTLPLWMDVFTEVRVVHVVRHGVDVAASLRARHRAALARRGAAYRSRRRLYRLWPKRTGFTDSLRCATLEGGFSLWEEYVTEGRAHVGRLGSSALELRYEDLVGSPEAPVRGLASFCGVEPPQVDLASIARGVKSERALAFRGTPELDEFAEASADRLRRLGYG